MLVGLVVLLTASFLLLAQPRPVTAGAVATIAIGPKQLHSSHRTRPLLGFLRLLEMGARLGLGLAGLEGRAREAMAMRG